VPPWPSDRVREMVGSEKPPFGVYVATSSVKPTAPWLAAGDTQRM
jgi:hypothetical protein